MIESYRYPNARLVIFSRAPQAGFSKTRLIPVLDAQGAADLQARLLRRTVELAVRSRLAPVELWCTPSCDHPIFGELASAHPIALFAQIEGDLGVRMADALCTVLATADAALLIGTDCPALERGHLAACLDALIAGHDAVLLPAEDGGYVAIGLRHPAPWLFTEIAWGTDLVMEQTRAKLLDQDWSWQEPAVLWDVDDPADWVRMSHDYPELAG